MDRPKKSISARMIMSTTVATSVVDHWGEVDRTNGVRYPCMSEELHTGRDLLPSNDWSDDVGHSLGG